MVDASARASVVAINTEFKNLQAAGTALLPQRLAIIGQGASASVYSTVKRQVTSANEVGTLYGFGSPLHLAALQVFPENGDGVGTIPVTIYPLVDDGAGVVSTGDVTPSAVQTVAASYQVLVNNIPSKEFVIAVGDSVAQIVTAMTTAINAVLEMPIIAVDGATQVDFTSKWEGTSANDIFLEILTPDTGGATFVITQPVGGLVNPDVDAALTQIGDVWENFIINCMEIADSGTLDKIFAVGDGRWDELISKPFIAVVGNTIAAVGAATVVSDARKTDRVNGQAVAPGSNNLPLTVAARQTAKAIIIANNNPARAYGSQQVTGITPGTDAEQWTFAERDLAIKAGSSGVRVVDGIILIADLVTFYHPVGEVNPAFSYFSDIVKNMNVIFSLDLIFNTAEWDSAPLIPNNQPTTNRDAKKPKDAVAEIATMLDNLGSAAIISDPATAKLNTTADIDGGNPKRLNISLQVQLSGNAKVIPINYAFGFFFGG